jgi:hypothetical protein
MYKPSTLKSIFSLVLLVSAMQVFSQEWKGLSLGADLSRFIVPAVDSTRYGWEVSGDFELMKDVFGVVEIGSQNTAFDHANYDYKSGGGYTRVGVDYNYMKHLDPESTDQLLVGLRYGFTTFWHEADNIIVHDPIWGNFTGGSIDRKWLGANWMEITTGMRAELLRNLYLGWSIRFRINIWQQADDHMQPYHVPGYGRAWNNSAVGINYSLYYKIPIIKKKDQSKKTP